MFALILGLMLLSDGVVAAWMVRRGPSPAVKAGLLAFAVLPALQIVWMVVHRPTAIRAHEWVPMPLVALSYLWNLIVAPLSALLIGAAALLRRLPLRRRPPAPPDLSRRRVLKASVALVPPLGAVGTLAYALPRLGDFRIRSLELPLPGLPDGLDGLVIAHLSDLHYGKFTKPRDVDRMVDAVNAMDADLALFTGDLIDLSIRDLPAALDTLGRIRAKGGLFVCEGNHDLIDDPEAFRRDVRERGIALLLDEARTVEVAAKGRVGIHGVPWARDEEGRRAVARRARERIGKDAFPILLAHHPHTFDGAQGFPLTLSGHTHGGMLMWNERLGAGPILYRYWSGPYTREDRTIVVSNGIGNWFPLRIHAPAEITRLTLRARA
ncbi:MAG TPA: metallophosphoesterase [Candidatus Eisenbacteria bacterium]|nr:metallophosphoesterase [Candidatus Eisenbacteria bacterium]